VKAGFATHAVRLYAWVLMDNHFHLLVRTPRANLSQFMQRLNTSYALYLDHLLPRIRTAHAESNATEPKV